MKVERKRRKQSQDMIERRFIDKKWEVRATLAGRKDWTPTLDQFRKGLTDEHYLVREAWIYRNDLPIAQEFIEIGLTDEWEHNRLKMTEILRQRLLYNMHTTPTLEQIVRGLADENKTMQHMWAEQERNWIELEGTPTHEQIEKGLTDADERVCNVWMSIARRQLCTAFDDNDNSTFLSI
ncbi:hypothetical protein HAP94_05695 [Acidithiobacillus ferrivorans]|nr:hypothetical protein [Acidithiobacillus ferrivorans]